MKIGIQTWGSNGDIRPLIALAEGLTQAGHTVTLVVSSIDNRSYADTCATRQIQYQQIPAHIDFDMPEFAQRSFRMNTLQWLNALLDACFFPYETLIYQTAQQLVAENDIVIGHHFLYPLKLAAKKQGKPHVSVSFCQALIETKQPPFRFPNLGKTLNHWQWKLMYVVFDALLKKRLSQLWRSENMPPVRHVIDDLLSSDTLNLVAVEAALCAEHAQWQAPHRLCGFLNLQETAENWQPSDALQDFLNAGEKPVYMTFGSVQQAVAEWSMALFIQAAELADCRAIIQTSSPCYPAETQQDQCFFIGRHPHSALFPNCAAVVHHGGAGTTHAATLSGCPSIVVPFMDEQLFWALQLQQAGLAFEPLPAKHATAQKLAARLRQTLKATDMAQRAKQTAQTLSPTQGVLNAVALIELSQRPTVIRP